MSNPCRLNREEVDVNTCGLCTACGYKVFDHTKSNNKDTTELDELIFNRASIGMTEFKELLLLWRDTEVIKEIQKVVTILENREDTCDICFENEHYIKYKLTELQSNLKEKE